MAATGALAQLIGYLDQTIFSLAFALFLAAILVLERLRPAVPSQPLLSRGSRFDLGVGILAFVVHFFVLVAIMGFLFDRYRRYLPSVGGVAGGWPNWVKILVAFVATDFALWLSHLVRHKVPALWRFHAFHHSQRELNAFTEYRLHPVDQIANSVLISLPLFLVQIPFESAVAWVLAQKYYLMFVHANVDIGYGPLDRVFVSPRVHRVHHALDTKLHDRNFGVYLTLWDTIFRTWHRAMPPSLPTGVADFVDERGVPWYRLPSVYLRQIVSPFFSRRAA